MFNLPQNQDFNFKLPIQSTSGSPFSHLLPSQSNSSYPTSGPPQESWLHPHPPQIQLDTHQNSQPLSSNPFSIDEFDDQAELNELGSDDQLLSMPLSKVVRRRSSKGSSYIRL
jgi:hypothetical protein